MDRGPYGCFIYIYIRLEINTSKAINRERERKETARLNVRVQTMYTTFLFGLVFLFTTTLLVFTTVF